MTLVFRCIAMSLSLSAAVVVFAACFSDGPPDTDYPFECSSYDAGLTNAAASCLDCAGLNEFFCEAYFSCICRCAQTDTTCQGNCESRIDQSCASAWSSALFFTSHDCDDDDKACTLGCTNVPLPVSTSDLEKIEESFGGTSNFPAPACKPSGDSASD
jgi:hypothetical protein